ncbi:MAG: DUF4249 domain-containing protein [Marinilabiliaceae bacterium]|nr:DUF4249 domain-containing protein [Marinilabiliaceae bacterium]
MILFKNTCFLLLVLAIVTACEKEIEYQGDNLESFLVLNASLQTDSAVTCYVSRSRTLLEKDPIQTIDDAVVDLYSDDVFVEELKLSDSGKYRAPTVMVQSGKKYELRVNHQSFKNVSASSVVPEKANAEFVSVQLVNVRTDGYTSEKMRFSVNVKDKPGKDYYRLQAFVPARHYNELGEYVLDENVYYMRHVESSDPVLNGNVVVVDDDFSDHPENQYRVFNDELFDEGEYELTFELDENDMELAANIKIDVQKISYDLYLYYKTLDAYNYYEDSPFSEPVRIHSNIINGAGVLGSCTSNWLSVE